SRSRSVQKERGSRDHDARDRDRARDSEKDNRRRRSRSKDRGDVKKKSRSHSRDSKKRSSDKDAKPKGSNRDSKESKEPKVRERSRSRDRKRRSRSRSRDRRRRKSPSKERSRRRSRSQSRPKDRRRVDRSRSRERRRRSASRSKSRDRRRRSRSGGRRRKSISRSPIRGRGLSPFQRRGGEDMSTEERDLRTVFCMQLSQRIRARDLEEFFSAVGKVRDVRMIVDNKTRKSKGIAYVEFVDLESVPLAMGLNGQKLFGVPIIVQATQAERNPNGKGPMRLYVGSLHFDITDRMLKEIFEPFGRVDRVELMREDSGKSKGFAFLTFREADAAKKAMEQLNGFEIAGRPIKVNHVTERGTGSLNHHHHHHHHQQQAQLDGSLPSVLDNEELDRTGIELGAHGRLALMAKLAEGTGIQLPDAAKSALQQMTGHSGLAAGLGMSGSIQAAQQQIAQTAQTEQANPLATQCFLLANMFDPAEQAAKDNDDEDWAGELRDDVLEECRKHGGAVHCLVDKSTGNVYVKCPSIATAAAAVGVLHGRYFAGRVITAAYVPVVNYHQLFPDAVSANQLL
ncbi:RNA-binding protein 39-like, partial [Tropilaelaps mercedesae]